MKSLPHNYVVEDFDFQELAGPNQITGHFDVGLRWRAVLRGMIMYQNAGAPGGYNNRPEDFTSLNGAGVQIAEGDQIVANNPSPGVEDQNDQCFFAFVEPVRVDDVLSPILHGALGSIDHLSRKRAFSDPHDFESVSYTHLTLPTKRIV